MASNKQSIPSRNFSTSHLDVLESPPIDTFSCFVDAKPSRQATADSRSPDVVRMVDAWLETQSSPELSEGSVRSSSSTKSRGSESLSLPSVGKKQVHWASNLEDYDRQFHCKQQFKAKTPSKAKETKPILSKTNRRRNCPPVPEPPRSRGPPPAPRPRRLPTPELPELDHGDFCSCCTRSVMKMNAQMAAASMYMSSTMNSRHY